jgi:glycosyltransferase involved in cell wall biosynthesis
LSWTAVKIALLTTAPSVRSGIGDYTRHLLPYLEARAEVELFVRPADASERPDAGGRRWRSAGELDPRAFDRLLFQLGNEQNHAYMLPLLRRHGGTVVQHDWVLFDLALAAHPALARGGLKGHLLALSEGGPREARIYLANWLDRRRERRTPFALPAPAELEREPGPLVAGWHAREPRGRWLADEAALRIPARGVKRVRIGYAGVAGRVVAIRCGAEELHRHQCAPGAAEVTAELERPSSDQPLLVIATSAVAVTPEQRRHGDARRLATFVRTIEWDDAHGSHALDLDGAPNRPIVPVSLSRDRFELAFNRSVVRFADAFIVHSRYVRERIEADRNQPTPIGVVHHGAESRWREGDRAAERRALGLSEEWARSFLITSFGGVQQHKRVDRVLQALARARAERPRIRMVLAGTLHPEVFDARGYADALGIGAAVHFTDWVPEEVGWSWLHCGDVSVNLRGPSTGGTSGGIFQAFAAGRAVIASDAAEQSELPDACVLKVPLGEGEVEGLARAFIGLCDHPERVRELEQAARRFVEQECHWDKVAAEYVEFLERFPPHRVKRQSLVQVARELGQGRG